MTGIDLLTIVLGMATVYLMTCMLVSGAQELLARLRHSRGQFLRQGLQSVLEDRWIYLRLLHHPLIVAMYRDMRPNTRRPPSYLSGTTVARALTDVILQRWRNGQQPGEPLTIEAIREGVAAAKSEGLVIGAALTPLVNRAQDVGEAMREIADWYDASMERVSGWFKADTQKWLFVLGLAVAAALDIDSIELATHLARSSSAREYVAARAESLVAQPAQQPAAAPVDIASVRSQIDTLGLPIGYSCLAVDVAARPRADAAQSVGPRLRGCTDALATMNWLAVLLKLVGHLITAVAVTVGAPFWFDMAARLVGIRSSGARPVRRAADPE